MARRLLAVLFTLAVAAPASAQLATNLVACYPMDEASGNAIDIVGGRNGVETSGTIASASGIISGARDFAVADTEYFVVADDAVFDMGAGDYSISAWVNSNTSATSMRVVSKMDTSSPFTGYGLLRTSATTIQAQVSDGTLATVSGANTANGAWHHLVVTRSGANILIYVDGTPSSVLTGRSGSTDNAEPLLIGAFNATTPTTYWGGQLDEIGIWKGRVLSGANVTQLFNAGAGISCATTAADTGSAAPSRLLVVGVG